MKAPPAFQFYPDVFEQGTADLTLAEVGGYMRLLNAQWAQGFIPGDDVKRLAIIMRCTPTIARKNWIVLRSKFVRGSDGNWRNSRMELERTKQDRYRESQANHGKLGGRSKGYPLPTLKPNESPREAKPALSPPSPSPSLEQKIPPKGSQREPKAFRRGRQRQPLPDPWHQQERMAEMRRLIADGLSYRDAQRKAFG